MSSVPSFSFCSISLSPPSWLEPKTTTLALSPSLALARFANSSARLLEQRARLADVAELDLRLRERRARDEYAAASIDAVNVCEQIGDAAASRNICLDVHSVVSLCCARHAQVYAARCQRRCLRVCAR